MSSPTILRPLRLDERPWNVRYAALSSWLVFGGLLVYMFYSCPHFIQQLLVGDRHAMHYALSVGVYPVVMLFATVTVPRVSVRDFSTE
jgi:hypothetical protein